MSSSLRNSAKRVQTYLANRGFAFKVKELLASTRTAQEAADSIGCTVSQIAKSLVFKNMESGCPVLVIASGSNRVDLKKIEMATRLKLGRADGKYVKERTGYAIGGVPPAGHNEPMETILDSALQSYDEIWAAAGTPFAVFRLQPSDLESLTEGKWIDLSKD